MNTPEMTKSAEAPPADLTGLVRYRVHAAWNRISTRRVLIVLGLGAVGAGLVLNWSWLTAIGVAPVLAAAAPCAAMCALGLCMPRMMSGNSGTPGRDAGNTPDQGSVQPEPVVVPTNET